MDAALADSFRYCEELARREAGNFYPAFRILPGDQRRAMCALYAYMRIADDCGDEPGAIETKVARLDEWRGGLHAALRGEFRHPAFPALAQIVERYDIRPEHLEAVLDGIAMDLGRVEYETFEQLRLYCYRVASVVGLACIRIWGCRVPAAESYAEQAGIAFQLTNILRDLREDADRSRVYLPVEDLARFGYPREALVAARRDDAFRELMRFEIARAKSFYEASAPLAAMLERPGRAVFLMMSRTYRSLLDAIEARDYDVFSARVGVSRWRKLRFALGVLPVRFGLR